MINNLKRNSDKIEKLINKDKQEKLNNKNSNEKKYE